jgi:hypothetical protein
MVGGFLLGVQGGRFHTFVPSGVSPLVLLEWGRFFAFPWLKPVEFLCPLAIKALEFLFSQVRSGSGWCSPAKDFTGFGLGSDFLVCFPAKFLTWFFFVWVSFFGVRYVHFGWFFQDTHISTMVVGFFRSSNLQPRSCQFFTLGAWPTHAREITS